MQVHVKASELGAISAVVEMHEHQGMVRKCRVGNRVEWHCIHCGKLLAYVEVTND